MLLRSRLFYAHHSMKELINMVSQHYSENKLHELSDETILTYGRLRRIPIVGKRNDIIRRLYKYMFRRECSEQINVICYDLEFTGLPEWDTKGAPNQDIIEIGAYHPETSDKFSCLVKPQRYEITPEAASLTQLTSSTLYHEGIELNDALKNFYSWVETVSIRTNRLSVPSDSMAINSLHNSHADTCIQNLNKPNMNLNEVLHRRRNTMLISHGGLMQDIRMLKYFSNEANITIPEYIYFADSVKILRECIHKNGEKLGTMKLDLLAKDLGISSSDQSHRALSDALITWKVLNKALTVHGNHVLSPVQELTKKFHQWNKR